MWGTADVEIKMLSLLSIVTFEDEPLAEFMYLVFTRMPGESYRRLSVVVSLVTRVTSIQSY